MSFLLIIQHTATHHNPKYVRMYKYRRCPSEVQKLLHQRRDREAKSSSKLLMGEINGIICPSYGWGSRAVCHLQCDVRRNLTDRSQFLYRHSSDQTAYSGRFPRSLPLMPSLTGRSLFMTSSHSTGKQTEKGDQIKAH